MIDTTSPTPDALSIPVGTALDLADRAQAVADDARRLAQQSSEATAEDLLTSIRLLVLALSSVFTDLGLAPEMSEELASMLAIGSSQNELNEIRQQIIESNDLAGNLAAEVCSRRALEGVVARLMKRVNDLERS